MWHNYITVVSLHHVNTFSAWFLDIRIYQLVLLHAPSSHSSAHCTLIYIDWILNFCHFLSSGTMVDIIFHLIPGSYTHHKNIILRTLVMRLHHSLVNHTTLWSASWDCQTAYLVECRASLVALHIRHLYYSDLVYTYTLAIIIRLTSQTAFFFYVEKLADSKLQDYSYNYNMGSMSCISHTRITKILWANIPFKSTIPVHWIQTSVFEGTF